LKKASHEAGFFLQFPYIFQAPAGANEPGPVRLCSYIAISFAIRFCL